VTRAASTRVAHRLAHPACPNGATSWAQCDHLAKYQFGQCKANVGDREPHPCSRWAVSESGWCGQHYTSELERVKRERLAAEKQLQLDKRINAYLEHVMEHPSIWDSERPPKGMAKAVRKGPHRLTAPA
jgi:hypothetical protein